MTEQTEIFVLAPIEPEEKPEIERDFIEAEKWLLITIFNQSVSNRDN